MTEEPAVVDPPDAGVGGPDVGPPQDSGGSSTHPQVCLDLLSCLSVAAPDQYDEAYGVLGPGGSCFQAIGLEPGTCEAACADGLQSYREDDEC